MSKDKETVSMIMRNVDPELRKALKIKAAEKEIPMNSLIIEILEKYLSEQKS